MSSMQPGWYPDPFGRFARRYHDGRAWTEHVADQQGTQLSDAAPLAGQTQAHSAPSEPATSGYQQPAAGAGAWQQPGAAAGGSWGQPGGGYAQPAQPGYTQPAQPTYGQPGQQGWGQTATGYAGAGTTGASAGISGFLGVIIAGVGALLVIIGVLALDWYKLAGDGANRSDVSDFVDGIKDLGGDPNVLSSTFFSFGWILAIVVALAAVGAALMKPTALRIAGAALSGVMLLWTLFGWLNLKAYATNDSNAAVLGTADLSLGIGGWVTLIGFVLLGVGAFIGGKLGGPSTAAAPANRPY